MGDDLFGPKHHEHWSRFITPVVVPRKKTGKVRSSPPAPLPVRRVPDAIDEKIRQHRAEDHYYWCLEELQRWKRRLPKGEWLKLQAHVQSLKPQGVE